LIATVDPNLRKKLVREAETAIAGKDYDLALRLAADLLAIDKKDETALLIVADTHAKAGSPAPALAAYLEVLALSPASARAHLGAASMLKKLGRPEEARDRLQILLKLQPGSARGVALMFEVLSSVGKAEEAGPFIDAAEQAGSEHLDVQLTRAKWLLAVGRSEAGTEQLERLVQGHPRTPGAWNALVDEVRARGDASQAADLASRASDACPTDFWLWRRVVHLLSEHGEEAALHRHLHRWPAPAVQQGDEFFQWARLMQHVENSSRVWSAWEKAEADAQEAFLDSIDRARLIGQIAEECGHPSDGIRTLRDTLAQHASDLRFLRQLSLLAICAGEVDVVNRLASLLHRLQPFGGVLMLLVHEVRIFESVMQRVREIARLPREECLLALSEMVLEEPQCIPLAIAWLNQFRVSQCADRPVSSDSGLIPHRLYFAADLTPECRAAHVNYERVDLRTPECADSAKRLLSAEVRAGLQRHPIAARHDILRLAALRERGGWWAGEGVRCMKPLERLSVARGTFVAVSGGLLLGNELLGCAAGHDALGFALDVAFTALDELAPRDDVSQKITGSPALTLGVAASGARAIVAGQHSGIVVLTERAQKRLLRSSP
jgi:tetratricopeptide (TPR) repeat protein